MAADILTLPPPPTDERIPYGADASQFGELRHPAGPGPHPVMVVLHGGFWRAAYGLEHIAHLCAALTADGIATWSLEYRRLGQPEGGWPGTFRDVGLGADHLRSIAGTYNLDLDRVAAIGHSAGGHLALWLAARPRLSDRSPLYAAEPMALVGAVSLAGVVDLRRASAMRLGGGAVDELMGGTPEQVPERYAVASPLDLLPLGTPQVLVHGTADDRVPYEISERYHARATELGDSAELVSLPGMGHFEVIDPRSAAWREVCNAARRTLG